MNIEALIAPVMQEARLLGMMEARQQAGTLTKAEEATLESTRALLAQKTVELVTTIKVETAQVISERLVEQEQNAFNYITALVLQAGGVVEMTEDLLTSVDGYQLERAETPDNGLILRAFKPQEERQIETPPKRDIILPEGLH